MYKSFTTQKWRLPLLSFLGNLNASESLFTYMQKISYILPLSKRLLGRVLVSSNSHSFSYVARSLRALGIFAEESLLSESLCWSRVLILAVCGASLCSGRFGDELSVGVWLASVSDDTLLLSEVTGPGSRTLGFSSLIDFQERPIPDSYPARAIHSNPVLPER